MNCNHPSITPSEYAVAPARLAPYTHTPTGDYEPDDDPGDDPGDEDGDNDDDDEIAGWSQHLPQPTPTAVRPGSDEKVAVLVDRRERGLALWHADDTSLLGGRAYGMFVE